MKKEHTIEIDLKKCIGCGMCRKDCPAGNILVKNKKAEIVTQDCIKCGHCAAVCPKSAVFITGFDESPVQIKDPVILDPHMLLDAIRTRRSIRQFTKQPVAPELIAQIIEAGRLTPTGGNAQNVSFAVLRDRMEKCEELVVRLFRRLYPLVKPINPMAKHMVIDDHFFFKKAPVAIMILSPDPVNGALAASNRALMAEACGLAYCTADFCRCLQSFPRPAKGTVVTTLVIGYSGVTYHRTAPKEAATVRLF